MIANLLNIPASDEGRAQWAFSHMAHHRDVNRVIFQRFGVQLPEYTLGQINPRNPGTWIDQHQIMHNNMNAVLNIAGADLTDVEWQNQVELAAFIQLNFIEHLKANDLLGL
jgi:hypothetical protein